MSGVQPDAVLALRAAVQTRLSGDAALTALIGAGRIFDEAPRAATGPYLVHGEVEASDASAGTERACEQLFSLLVWAGQGGSSRLALEVAAAAVAALDGADLALEAHGLADLRWLSSRLSREAHTGLPRVTLRFRALSEPLDSSPIEGDTA